MWTPQQLEAIEKKGNLLVSAAAGAGKTAVMTERIVKLISEGARADELLVVTFTKPAAAEMKERIEKKLLEKAAATDDAEQKYLLSEAANDISRANISTIHSFCRNVLKRNYNEAGIDPAFKVADDAEASLLMKKAMDGAVEDFYLRAEKDGGSASQFIIRALHKNGGIEATVEAIYYFITARPDPMLWLERAINAYRSDFETAKNAACAHIMSIAKRDIEVFYQYAKRLYDENEGRLLGSDEKYIAVIREDMDRLFSLSLTSSYDTFCGLAGTKLFSNLPKGTPEFIKKYREELKKLTKNLEKLFSLPLSEEKRLASALFPALKELAETVRDFAERYRALKRDASLIDFSDMEQLTLEVLRNEEIAEEYREKFRYIFVDEYQDTNLVQESIISRIARGGNLFMVGDVKQSIYRFRQAEPRSFIDKYNSYDGTAGTRIDLNCNFRSTTAVLGAANALFSKLMLGEVGEIDYSDNAELRPAEGASEGFAELALIDVSEEEALSASNVDKPNDNKDKSNEDPSNSDKNEDKAAAAGEMNSPGESGENDGEGETGAAGGVEELENIEAEAAYIASRIRELMKEGKVFDKEQKTLREPVFSDFAVLMRRTKGPALKLVNSLSERGIPCTAELGDGYFDAIEVQIFINLLRAIDNTRQDIPLVSVMRSPIGGFTDAELAEIKADFRSDEYELFIDRMKAAALEAARKRESVETPVPLYEKCAAFLEKLADWRRLSRLEGMEALIGRLFDETGFSTYTGALPGGEVRKANLDMLLEKAHAFDSAGRRGLNAFINLLDSVRDNTNMGAAQSAGVDAVRVMSIHKSKGLEFPIVFICGLTGQFSTAGRRSAAVLDDELGIGLRIGRGYELFDEIGDIDPEKAQKPLFRRAIEAKDASKQAAEEMRVLYVGMTRARERLYMVGAKKKMRAFIEKNAVPLTDFRIMNARSYLEWILGAFFPFGLDSERAEQGFNVPLGGGSPCRINTLLLRSEGGAGEGAKVTKKCYNEWKEEAKRAPHGDIDALLSFAYGFEKATRTPAKSSVTELAEPVKDYTPAQPLFLREEGERTFSGAERGTLTHRLIMLLPIAEMGEKEIKEELSHLTDGGFFTEEEAAAVDIESVARLFASPLYKRLLASERVEREREFSLLTETGALLQGAIDCCFIENGEWVLIDYKTTALRGRSAREVAEGYRGQLDLYKQALEKLTGLPVKEEWVYLLSADLSCRL